MLIATEASGTLWSLVNQKQHGVRWLGLRSHLLSEAIEFTPDEDGTTGTLSVTGHIRARSLDPNHLVYVPGYGAFQLLRILTAVDPFAHHAAAVEERAVPSSELLESLQMEMPIDPMSGEQTWPTEEELHNADLEERVRRAKAQSKRDEQLVKAPKGTSSYQAAWIADEDGEDDNHDGSDDSGDDENEMHAEDGEGSDEERSSCMDENEDDSRLEDEMDLVPRKENAIDNAQKYDDEMMKEGFALQPIEMRSF